MKQGDSTQLYRLNQVKVTFTEKPITAWGGLALLMGKLLEVIDFRAWVERIMPIDEVSPNGKGIYEKVLGHFLTVLCGGVRFSHVQWWNQGRAVLCRAFGVSWLPQASSTLTRFWGKFFLQRHADGIAQQSRQFVRALLDHEGITVEDVNLDSSVVCRYGHQDGARRGYNPRKPGRPSHHPLFAFLGTGHVLNVWNRPGDCHSAHRALEFFDQTVSSLDPDFVVRHVLCDTGFYEVHFIEHLEQECYQYIIAVPLYSTMQRQLHQQHEWTFIEPGLEACEFFFQHLDEKWTSSRRYVAIRQEIRFRPQATGKQLSLFAEVNTGRDYRYAVFITNNYVASPHEIWLSYRPRAKDENVIKDLKEGYGFASFNLDNFWATETIMIVNALLIHNLIVFLMGHLLKEHNPQPQLRTIRLKYFIIPALLGRNARSDILRLSVQQSTLREKLGRMFAAIEATTFRTDCIAV